MRPNSARLRRSGTRVARNGTRVRRNSFNDRAAFLAAGLMPRGGSNDSRREGVSPPERAFSPAATTRGRLGWFRDGPAGACSSGRAPPRRPAPPPRRARPAPPPPPRAAHLSHLNFPAHRLRPSMCPSSRFEPIVAQKCHVNRAPDRPRAMRIRFQCPDSGGEGGEEQRADVARASVVDVPTAGQVSVVHNLVLARVGVST